MIMKGNKKLNIPAPKQLTTNETQQNVTMCLQSLRDNFEDGTQQ